MQKNINIVINYANEEEVIYYAKQLALQSISDKLELVIVNNKSSDNIQFDFQEELNKINLITHLFCSEINLGYLNGAFFGYRKYIELKKEHPRWTVISNTDILIKDRGFFKKFFGAKYSKDTWCIAPSVFNSNNQTYDNPKYINRITDSKMKRSIFVHKIPLLSALYLTLGKYKAKKDKERKKDSQYAYAVQGCFFALKIDFMKILMNNEYKGFLFGEENYIAELIRKYQKKCYCNNDIEVIHNEKASTGGLNYKKRASYYAESHKYIYNEFY